jgi:hypothetical protein
MPNPVTSPAPAVSPAQGAGAEPQDPSKGRDRIARLVAQREEAKKARDQAIAAVQDLQSKLDAGQSEMAELRKAVAELTATQQAAQAKPRSPWADWTQAPDDQLAAIATSGTVDPVTGAKLPPDPTVMARALSELAERRARQIAEQMVNEKVGGLKSELSAQQKAQAELAAAERRIMALYKDDGITDPQSPLRQTVEKLFPVFAQEYGQPYATSPAGYQHLFAEAARMVKGDEARRVSEELAQIKAREAAALSRQYGPGGPPAPPSDEVTEGLKKRAGVSGVRDAIKGLSWVKERNGGARPR